jgi:D-alanyl-D-alanine carboxypeptidase (penicillin-binding protein 5/6)
VTAALLTAAAPASAEPDGPPAPAGDAAVLQPAPAELRVDPAAPPLPAIPVRSFVLADLDSGDILAQLAPHAPLPPASTLKVLTALTVLPGIDLDATMTATEEDVAVAGTRVGIEVGSSYTGRQLAQAMMLMSGNDAAAALATLNGGLEATVEQMQAQALRLGATDTVVRNPHGLDAPGQVSSAHDLVLLARAALAQPAVAELATLDRASFPSGGPGAPNERATFEIANHNDLVTGGFEGGIGLKSGYTTLAGRTMVGAAERDGRRYVVALLGIDGPTYGTAAAYLDWAFANGAQADPVGQLAPRQAAPTERTGADAAAVVPFSTPAKTGLQVPVWPVPLLALAAVLVGLRVRARARIAAAPEPVRTGGDPYRVP